MPFPMQIRTTILPGHRIEIHSPELPEGRVATVLIQIVDEPEPAKRRLSEILGDYPGGQLFHSAAEVDAYLKMERAAWDS